jgi:hypothetical protein
MLRTMAQAGGDEDGGELTRPRSHAWRTTQRRSAMAFAALVLASVLGLGVLFAVVDGARLEITVNIVAALLFYGLGALQNDMWRLRRSDPRRIFAHIFGIEPDGDRRATFNVVLPQFELSHDVSMRDSSETGVLVNPTIGPGVPIVVDELNSRNDARAGGRIGSVVSGVTGGFYRPRYINDNELNTDNSRSPSVVLGSYSNNWVRSYWDYTASDRSATVFYCTDDHGLDLKGMDGRVTFWPRDAHDGNIRRFYEAGKPPIAEDLGIFARVRAQDGLDSMWLVCAGVGPAATDGIAQYLARSDDGKRPNLIRIIDSFGKEATEFVVAFRVSAQFIHNVREIHRWPK